MKKYFLGCFVVYAMYLQTGCGGGSRTQTPQPLAITSSTPPSGTTGAPYAGNGFALTASGGRAPYNWSWAPGSALPPGLTLSNGMIAGTPTTPGTYNVVIQVADSQSPPAQKSSPYTIKVTAGPLVITSGAPPSGIVGANYASSGFSLTASGGATPYIWSWVAASGSTLPPGLTISNATISGAPTTAGTYNVLITVSDSQSPVVQTSSPYTITVAATPPLQITSGNPPNATVGLTYANHSCGGFPPVSPCPGFFLDAAGGVSPYTWSWTGAQGSSTPPGLRIMTGPTGTKSCAGSSAWRICGTPSTVGTYNVVVTVSDSASPPNQVIANYTIKINPAPLTIATNSVAVGAINLPYSFVFSATGGYPPYNWIETGALPPGMNLAADGTLSGTPTVTGSFPVTVTVADSKSQSVPANFTIQVAANGFKATGSMANARASHTATLLKDGRVLVTGGGAWNAPINSAEIYDPLTFSFSPTNNLITPRADHTATLLNDGRVLVAGGYGVASAEVYDPTSGNFVSVGSMHVDRDSPTATLLKDGRVLVTGGIQQNGTWLASAEIFDPATNSFTATGSMSIGRHGHTATLISNGKVLITGGFSPTTTLASAELYDPATGKFAATGSMVNARVGHTATALNNNTVVVIGGQDGTGTSVLSAEIYDPAMGTFSVSGQMATGVQLHTATLLPVGQVLVAGGSLYNSHVFTVVSTAELFDPTTGNFSLTGSMISPRELHTATLLNDGTVLMVGGEDTCGSSCFRLLDTTELYQ